MADYELPEGFPETRIVLTVVVPDNEMQVMVPFWDVQVLEYALDAAVEAAKRELTEKGYIVGRQ
jgi:hypothetical protein